jgi:uncharacterized protein YdiU (UPF0061 family)
VSEDALVDILDMDPAIADGDDAKQFADFVSGNLVLEASIPMSHRYGGHQFGYWVSIMLRISYFAGEDMPSAGLL